MEVLPAVAMDYDDPGPIDSSVLAEEGHALLLNPLVEMLSSMHNGDWYRREREFVRTRSLGNAAQEEKRRTDFTSRTC